MRGFAANIMRNCPTARMVAAATPAHRGRLAAGGGQEPEAIIAGLSEGYGGVVNVITETPSNTYAAQATTTIGGRGYYDVGFDVGGPLNADKTILVVTLRRDLRLAYENPTCSETKSIDSKVDCTIEIAGSIVRLAMRRWRHVWNASIFGRALILEFGARLDNRWTGEAYGDAPREPKLFDPVMDLATLSACARGESPSASRSSVRHVGATRSGDRRGRFCRLASV